MYNPDIGVVKKPLQTCPETEPSNHADGRPPIGKFIRDVEGMKLSGCMEEFLDIAKVDPIPVPTCAIFRFSAVRGSSIEG